MDEPGNRAGDFDRFEELAGARLYRRNAFAVTGLPVAAAGRAVRQQRQRLEARLAVEESWPGDADSPLAGGFRREDVRAAFEQLQDARRRLVDELLWRWGGSELGCGCPAELHAEHDAAVRAHAEALEDATGRAASPADDPDALWSEAADGWAATLAHPAFRDHVAHRIEALAEDRRIATLTPEAVLEELPRLLVSPFDELLTDAESPNELADGCAHFSRHPVFAPLVAEGFERIVDEGSREINAALRAAEEDRRDGRYADALEKVQERIVPAYEELEPYWPFVSAWRHEELSHLVAVGLNNLAVALLEYHRYQRASPEQSRSLVELAEWAQRITPGQDGGTIAENLRVIRQLHGHAPRRRTVEPSGQPADLYGCALFLIILVGLVAVIVTAVSAGLLQALLTGLGAVTLLGLVSVLGDAAQRRQPR